MLANFNNYTNIFDKNEFVVMENLAICAELCLHKKNNNKNKS